MGDAASRRSRKAGPSVLTPPAGLPVQRDVHAAVPAQRDGSPDQVPAQPPAPPAPQARSATTCTCGHERETHEHLRPGSDCGACGATVCSAYHPRSGRIRRALRRIGLLAD
ncbi:hypothetical protein [Pseudonocardia acidicola]|uniref:Uncharacterized protein n=1 Tax=Pseudonocardia acidicola TaxID=2724939 RepID=A0ABX1SGR5_9PSEU|nr:hypothetical protein [Pseudonocardia acidicola]NMI00261.1 hypothetical protein [Pseudonocardia acidicola]